MNFLIRRQHIVILKAMLIWPVNCSQGIEVKKIQMVIA